MSDRGVWIFGYGSLVDPSSFGATLGRALRPGVDFFEAELAGFGRRWNYGVMHVSASGRGPEGDEVEYTIVALGIVRAPDETVNGVVGWVTHDELALLDHRERHYDRIDVTADTTVHGAQDFSGPVAVYYPRHIVLGYVTMGLSAAFTFCAAVRRPAPSAGVAATAA